MPGNAKTRALARAIGVQTVARQAGVDIQRMVAEKPQQSGPSILPTYDAGGGMTSSPFEVLPMQSLPGGTRTLSPGTFPAPVPFNSPMNVNQLGTDITNTGCNLISDARLRAACILAGSLVFGGGGGGGGANVPTMNQLACPPGYKQTANGCQLEGLAPYIPGDVGRQDYGWQPVNGRYGVGYVPISVARTTRACPPGSKLGKDGVCYDRIARTNRLHDPGARPFLTGGEVNILRAARRLNKRKSKLLGLFPKPRTCAPKKKRR